MTWFESELPSWMRTLPVSEQIARSMHAAEGIGRAVQAGMNFGQRQQEQDAMLPLRQKMADNQQKIAAAELATKTNALSDEAANKLGFAELGKLVADTSTNGGWTDPANIAKIYSTAAKYPSVFGTKAFTDLENRIGQAAVLQQKADAASALAAHHQAQIEVQKERIGALQDQNAALIQSREKIAGDANQTKLDIADMSNENKIELQRMRNLTHTDASGKVVTEGEFVNRHLNSVMSLQGVDEQSAMSRLKTVYKASGWGEQKPAAKPTSSPAQSGITSPKSQEEYDALPPGTLFINPADGKQYIKK